MILITVSALLLAVKCTESTCQDLSISELCRQVEQCEGYFPDLGALCLARHRAEADHSTTILKQSLHFSDSSKPQVLALTPNITVAPGDTFKIECTAEGAPTPHADITPVEYADMADPESGGAVESGEEVLGMIRVSLEQPGADSYYDDGWYRCVARNKYGISYQDTHVIVLDLCENMDCESMDKVCQADYDTGTAVCVCPTCDQYDEEFDFVCGDNCASYFSECSLLEENCENGLSTKVYKEGLCETFSSPNFVELPEVLNRTETVGAMVQLTCRAEPGGDIPGPSPTIRWEDAQGRILGEGEILEYEVTEAASITCVAQHCPASYQEKDLVGATVHIALLAQKAAYEGRSCQVVGGPYISTFDGSWYSHGGVCSYVLSMDCYRADWFLYARFSECGNGAPCLEAITFHQSGLSLELQRGWLINNNGEKVDYQLGQVKYFGADIEVVFDGEYLDLAFNNGDNHIIWNGYNGVQVLVSETTVTCGLCGNNNGNPDDDFVPRWSSNTVSDHVASFIGSWKLNMPDFVHCYEYEAEIEISNQASATCISAFDNRYIQTCSQKVEPAPYIQACKQSYDQQISGLRAECNLLQSYILECDMRGAVQSLLVDWRHQTTCTTLSELQQFTIDQGCPQDNPPV